MPLKPEVTVAVLAEERGRFLTVEERIKGRNVFNQPAGHVEDGETMIEAVIREAREETAWRFTPEAFLGVYLWRYPDSGRYTLRFAFTGTVRDHDSAQPLDRGILRTHWLSRSELLEREAQLRSPLVLRCVDDYLTGRRLPLDCITCLDVRAAEGLQAARL